MEALHRNTNPSLTTMLTKNCFGRSPAASLVAFLLIAGSLSAQSKSPASPAPGDIAKIPVVSDSNATDDASEVVTLSPFSVVDDSKGWESFNTLSGTRLNSKLEDLGASITVVTKQQMLDTAVLDINDVFRYEASTEGTDNYTSFNRNRSGGVNDQVASAPQQANRIRGISKSGQSAGGANTAWGNFSSNNKIPFDLYNVDAIEVSRGPNSNLFGLGNAAGTVNVVPTQANPGRRTLGVSLRVDDRGGHRESFNYNQPLVSGKLAVRVAAVNESKGFTRKPASEDINREFVTLFARPFANTTIRASYESYHDAYRRPNSITPRDTTTEWVAAGSPTWNPVTRMVTLANGTTSGPFNSDSTTVAIPGVPGAKALTWSVPTGLIGGYNGFYAHPSVYIDQAGTIDFFTVMRTNNPVTSALPTNPMTGGNSSLRYLQSATSIMRQRDVLGPTGLPLYIIPGASDKSIYDWSSVNAIAPNYGIDDADTFSAEIEQIVLNTPHHLLAARAGMFSQHFDRYSIGAIDNLETVIYVDVNEKQLDGSNNPYFKRPYIAASAGRINPSDEDVDIVSAALAYQFTPTSDTMPRWLSWIGQQRIGAHAEVNLRDERSYNSTERISDAHDWIPTANIITTQRPAQRFYVGDNTGPGMDYAPAPINNIDGTYPFRWYNNKTGQWVTEQVTMSQLLESGQGARRRTEVRTLNATWQSFLLNDHLVLTSGWRRDRQQARTGAGSFINPTTGLADLSNVGIFGPLLNYQPPAEGSPKISLGDWVVQDGDTKTYGAVVKATPWLNFHFNKSDSFAPEIVRQSLGLGNVPNPHGYSTEYGFSITALEGKLNLRLTRFNTKELNSRGSEIGTLGNRSLDMEGRASSPSAVIPLPSFRNFATNLAKSRLAAAGNPNPTDELLLTEVAKLMAPYGTDQAKNEEWLLRLSGRDGRPQTVGVTDVSSEGYEFEAAYNPTPNWRFKFTGSKTQAQDDKVSHEIYDWWQTRIQVYESLHSDIVPGDGMGPTWWDSIPPGDSRTPQTRYIQDQFGPFWAAATNEGRPRTQIREYRLAGLTKYEFTEGRLRNFDIGGAVRWESKASIGYLAGPPETSGPYTGAVLFLDNNKPVWDKARSYFDLSAGYNFRVHRDKVRVRAQLNVRDVFESGRLQAVAVNPDGAPYAFRIIDPRQFIFSLNFDY